MSQIILDTNFLLIPAQFHVDVFEQLREFGNSLIILDTCLVELKTLARKKGKAGGYARVGLQLLAKNSVRVVATRTRSADDALVKYAENHGAAVATNDGKLIKRLRNKGIKLIRLRQKKFLVLE